MEKVRPYRLAVTNPRRRGIATLWCVLMLLVMFAFLAMAIDILWLVLAGHQLSAGADAASLAATMEVRRNTDDARDLAVAYADANPIGTDTIQVRRNDGNDPAGDVVIGRWLRSDQTFTPLDPGEGVPNAVKVVAPRTSDALGGELPTLFSSMIGVNTMGISRISIAMIHGDLGPAVLALDPTANCSLDMRGNISFTAQNAAIVIDSNHANAACHSGQPTLDTEELYVVGGLDGGFENQVDTDANIFTDAEPVPDPLLELPEPNEPALDLGDLEITTGTHVLTPGRYGNISITGGDITLLPGLYYIEGEFKYNGGNIDGTAGVMLFFAAPAGRINIAGNGMFHLQGMSPTLYPAGPSVPASVAGVLVPIFQSRSNTTTAEINGTNDWFIGGSVYAPAATLLVRGTPGTFANGLVAGQIHVRGTADLIVDYIDQFPRIPRHVFLVE